ncbi:MAG: DUF58 domain-containing protein [Kiritimatiellae bacterium]|nr:DUF58 domain-containing protein [Kiritimatiellia bacterium]
MAEKEGISAFLNTAQMAKLDRLALNSRYVVEGTLAGRHRSAQKGASTEFADHRSYMPGDDLKRIDWKVLGRTDKYYIRRYQDETNLRVYLLVDRSGSMNYSSDPTRPTKYSYACTLAAAIGYVVLKARDSIGMYIYGEKMDAALPCKNSFNELNNSLKILQGFKPAKGTNGADVMHQIAESINRRAMVVIISDLLDNQDELIKAIAHFRKNLHDVIVFHVMDPAELTLDLKRGAEFEDLETGERLVSDPRSMAKEYKDIIGEFIDKYRKACAEMKADYRLIKTDDQVDVFVRAYLEERKRLSR